MKDDKQSQQKRDKPWSRRLIVFAMSVGLVILGILEYFRHPFIYTRIAGVLMASMGVVFAITSLFGYGIHARGEPVEWPSNRDMALGCLIRTTAVALAYLIAWYLAWKVL